MRLRRPCEHGWYCEHGFSPYGEPSFNRRPACPGGEFLPEDAVVIEKVEGEWPEAVRESIQTSMGEWESSPWDAANPASAGTWNDLAIVILDALADQVGEPG